MKAKKTVLTGIRHAVLENDKISTYIKCSCFGGYTLCGAPFQVKKKCRRYKITAEELKEDK